MAVIGIDCGSSFCKGVLLEGGKPAAFARLPAGWNIAETGRKTAELLNAGEGAIISATGYGRERIAGARTTLTPEP